MSSSTRSSSNIINMTNTLTNYMPLLSLFSSFVLLYTTTMHLYQSPLLLFNLSLQRIIVLLTWNKLYLLLLCNIISSILYCITKHTVQYTYKALNSNELTSVKEFTLQYTVCRLILIAGMVENNLREIFIWLLYFGIYGCMRACMHIAQDRFITLNGTHTINAHSKQQCITIQRLSIVITTINIAISIWFCYMLYNTNSFHLLTILLLENGICLLVSCKILTKYSIELHHIYSTEHNHPDIIDNDSDDTEESGSGMIEKNQSQFLVDTIYDCCKSLLTGIHMCHIWIYCIGFTFSLIDLYFMFSSRAIVMQLYKRITSYIQYCAALRDIDTRYPNATQEQLDVANQQQELCAICREKMTSATKVLNCKHMLHTSCLRAWCEVKRQCPVCRSRLEVQSNTRDIIRRANDQPTHDIDADVLAALQQMDLGIGGTSNLLTMQQQQQLALDRYSRLRQRRNNNANNTTNTTNTNTNNSNDTTNNTTQTDNTSTTTSTNTATRTSLQLGRAILGQSLFRLSTPSFLAQYMPQISFELVRAHATSPLVVATTQHNSIRPSSNNNSENNSSPVPNTTTPQPSMSWAMFADATTPTNASTATIDDTTDLPAVETNDIEQPTMTQSTTSTSTSSQPTNNTSSTSTTDDAAEARRLRYEAFMRRTTPTTNV